MADSILGDLSYAFKDHYWCLIVRGNSVDLTSLGKIRPLTTKWRDRPWTDCNPYKSLCQTGGQSTERIDASVPPRNSSPVSVVRRFGTSQRKQRSRSPPRWISADELLEVALTRPCHGQVFVSRRDTVGSWEE
jgi:hypothetical protein